MPTRLISSTDALWENSHKMSPIDNSNFSSPPVEYRDAPFWAWNGVLKQKELLRQIEAFQKMGMGGFFMHSRTGLATQYMGGEFMDAVAKCTEAAKARGLQAWLYDEDRWPSGSVGGILTRNPRFRARNFALSFDELPPVDPRNDGNYGILAEYFVRLDSDGFLKEYRRCSSDDAVPKGFRRVRCYRKLNPEVPWFNGSTYIDVMNPKATREFIKLTHERYANCLNEHFGGTIPGIFSDEPQFRYHDLPQNAFDLSKACWPYTEKLPEIYRKRYGEDFFDTLPEIVWNKSTSTADRTPRYRYLRLISELFDDGFLKPIYQWCQRRNLQYAGHLMCEHSLQKQSEYSGEAMRHYRFFHIPGVDMLHDAREFTTVKQAVSVARQDGRKRVLCELDGVTDWDFPFVGHFCHGNWQAALGISMRVPHHAWYTMGGNAKRDYPASIGLQSPWHGQYHIIADHFARVNWALSQGTPLCHVAVIHPVESSWLLRGPTIQDLKALSQMEDNFQNLAQWLLFGLIDFDYLSEGLLPEQKTHIDGQKLHVGKMAYSTVIVPPTLTIRSSTLSLLEAFQATGGRVIFLNPLPELCDSAPSKRPQVLADKTTQIDFSENALLKALSSERELQNISKQPLKSLLYQLRKVGRQRLLFLTDSRKNGREQTQTFRLKGIWSAKCMDTPSGNITPISAETHGDHTFFSFRATPGSSMLLYLSPSQGANQLTKEIPATTAEIPLSPTAKISRDEPNVLVLDQPAWRISGQSWHPPVEIYRLDALLRTELSLPPRSDRDVQPWTNTGKSPQFSVELDFAIHTKSPLENLFLITEPPKDKVFIIDDKKLANNDAGFWIDSAMRKIPLPSLATGTHHLHVLLNYNASTPIERFFILGDFSVSLIGTYATLDAPTKTLKWGDWTQQGLPFYSGNIVYHLDFQLVSPQCCKLEFPQLDNPLPLKPGLPEQSLQYTRKSSMQGTLATISIDGKSVGMVMNTPQHLPLGWLSAGKHSLQITLYGHRFNSFGAFHQRRRMPCTPAAWFPNDNDFFAGYALPPVGLLLPPRLLTHNFAPPL